MYRYFMNTLWQLEDVLTGVVTMETCFAAAGQKLWYSLPVDLRQTMIIYEQLKRLLKTFLVHHSECSAL